MNQGFSEHVLSAGFSRGQFGQFSSCFRIRERRDIFFCQNDRVMPRGKQILVAAEEFPNESFHPIPENCIACFFGDCNPQAFDPVRVAACNHGEKPRTFPDPLFVNNPISAFIGNPLRSGVRLRFRRSQFAIPTGRQSNEIIRLISFYPWPGGG